MPRLGGVPSPIRMLTNSVMSVANRVPMRLPTFTSIDLRGKRVLVTGASSGIGECAARQLAAEGAEVIVVARRAEHLDEVAAQIAEAGGTAAPIPCDLSDLSAVDELVDTVEARFGGVDILVNNAAHSIRRPLDESLERWHDFERTMTLNYFSPLRLIRGLAPGMMQRGDGHIINVLTLGVLVETTPLFAPYAASKAALNVVNRCIEAEWAGKGVHSTAVYFPLVHTPMSAPTKAFHRMPGLRPEEAAEWIVGAARHRPARIAPRAGLGARTLDLLAPGVLNDIMARQLPILGRQ